MDTRERLSLESVSEYTVIACEHIHRYDFAAALCGGLRVLDLACGSGYGSAILTETATAVHGVDNDVATIDLAAATVGQRTAATFEVADATALLGEDLSDRYDMIVCFEALEHLNDLGSAVGGLCEQAGRGVQLIVSVPNSRAFEEENEFHVTDFGYDEAMSLLNKLPDAVMVNQYLTEGSLIGPQGAEDLRSGLINLEHAEPEYANHFILTSNIDEKHVLGTYRVRSQLVEAPVHNRYMRNLEVANSELRRRNNELARKMLGGAAGTFARAGSAAPSFVIGLNDRIEELSTRIAELETINQNQAGDIAYRDEMILAQRHELLQLRQQLLALREPELNVLDRVRRSLRRRGS
ncbi:MAG TPA: class I SAM-dependent methyltransferase [Solirubrobacteraceae bacterium]|nr:class I SAM-dependent methyltransferase [Solirubrobacteraceae bacterium]